MPLTFITAFAPASVGNIGVGFDLLGHAIDGPRDLATVRKIAEPVIHIEAITGHVAGIEHLPLDPERNTAGRALMALRERFSPDTGFALSLTKGIPLGSGLGGSAARALDARRRWARPARQPRLLPYPADG